MSAPPKTMDEAKAFAAKHVAEGARELLEQRKTSILRDGRVRELAALLRQIDKECALTIAENIFKNAALELAAKKRI